jgi:hypothetical protein
MAHIHGHIGERELFLHWHLLVMGFIRSNKIRAMKLKYKI